MKKINIVVDYIFVADMVLQFFIAYYDHTVKSYVFDQRYIVRKYLSGWFLFDFASVSPFFIELALDTVRQLEALRVFKVLRLVKLIRLAKIAKSITFLGDMFSMPGQYITLAKFFTILIFLLHWVA